MTRDDIEAKTNEIAKLHGCDRAVFTVCWAEHERGAGCRCKREARDCLKAALIAAERDNEGK